MIDISIQRCKIYKEFERNDLINLFDRKKQAVRQHIDTLYYSVYLDESKEENIKALLKDLHILKMKKQENMQHDITYCGLSVMATGFSIYAYRLSLNECFDIFISNYLPNKETPRIVVQLRSHMLVLKGPYESIEVSFQKVLDVCFANEIDIIDVQENRIDYAFHTNSIQDTYQYFGDKSLKQHLVSKLRLYQKVGNISKDITIDYFTMGNKKSNNLFFRCYNKNQEVIQKNYKSFFFDIWLQHGLISLYDYEVLNTAYEMKSYRAGILIGRMKFYLKYGTDESLKEYIQQLHDSYHIKSDNNDYLEKSIKGILPEVTTIINVEVMVKRKFYMSCKEFIGTIYDGYIEHYIKNLSDERKILSHIYQILSCTKIFIDYIFSLDGTICFVKSRDAPRREGGEANYCDWWDRIRSCAVNTPVDKKLEREYLRKTDIPKARRRLLSDIAYASMIKNNSLEVRDINEDFSDVLCLLNDNDLCGITIDYETGELRPDLYSREYSEIKIRKIRQYKGIIQDKQTEK